MPDKKNNNNLPPDHNEPVKVILADDDKDDQEIFEQALQESAVSAELTTVDNGQELIDYLKNPAEPNPDIIFLDLNMPNKDGKETLKEIKTDETLKRIPTVMLSTSDHPKDVEETFEKGANLYLRKPNSISVLVKLLIKVFSLHWARKLYKREKKAFFITEKDVSGKK